MSIGLSLNNPGDLRIGVPLFDGEKAPSSDPHFRQFISMEHGIRAVAKTLLTYYDVHGLKTLRAMAMRYAPPSENDTGLYVETLAERTGYDPDAEMQFPDDLQAVTEAFIDAEQGEEVKAITPQQFASGVALALHNGVENLSV